MEGVVRQAFLDRPRHVDLSAGFLGMEVFEDAADPAAFHLMTRWTDLASFHAWHRSDAHHMSHSGIPHGLKLDPAYTRVEELNRIQVDGEPTAELVTADHAPLIARFLSTSKQLHLLVAAPDGTILTSTEAMAARLKVARPVLRGASLWPLLTDRDAALIRERIAAGLRSLEQSVLLNFVASDHTPFTLECHVDVQPDAVIIIGEPTEGRIGYQEEMLNLNNELAALSRENARRGRALSEALDQLKTAQAMLVHREKLAALGVMTAGIAHEINNPVAFVLNNQVTLRRDLEDLLRMVEVVVQCAPGLAETNPEAHARITEAIEQSDVAYLATAVPKKLAANEEGLRRVQQIVLDLRTFSRLDEEGFKPCDVLANLTATVRMLEPLLKEHGVTVQLHGDGLPPLTCAPGPLNQAVANVIVNAVQASRPGQVVNVLATADDADCVIKVTDTGIGIPADDLPRVFDAFFTTKPVGSGTGLGLNIAHQVVDAHRGSISVVSEPGKGTTVRIAVPWNAARTTEQESKEATACISK